MNYRNFTLVVAILILLVSCGKNESENNRIVIKGTVSNVITKRAFTNSTNAIGLGDAKKVLLFNSSGGYELFNIDNNSFSVKAYSGTATALAFLAADNSFIGCLHAGGLNVLPLVSLKDGDNTVIDLSTLTLNGTTVIPANDPIGSVINLNQKEIERYRQLGSFYESLSKNMDADNDGIPDLIDKKSLFVSTMFDIYSGTWTPNSPARVLDISGIFVNYGLRLAGGKSAIPVNSKIDFNGPGTAPYSDIKQYYYTTGPDCFISFFRRETTAAPGSPFGSAFLPFKNGIYTALIDNKSYTLNYSNVDVNYFFIMPVPTIKTNDKNEITSVTVEYKDMNGNTVTPENFVYQADIMIRINNVNQPIQIGTLWESPEAKTNNELYNFVPSKPISVSEVTQVIVGYLDLIGNSYGFVFQKQ
jgi:hypothetical protein